MEDWDGTERRSSKVTLQDVLLEVREGRGEIRHLISDFKKHTEQDDKNFDSIRGDLEKSRKEVGFIQKVLFGITGAWVLFQFLVSVGAVSINGNIPPTNGNGPNSSRNNGTHVGGHQDPSGEGGLVRRPGSIGTP